MRIDSISIYDPEYTKRLEPASPSELFYIGDIGLLNTPSVAVIGSREVTSRDVQVAQDVGYFLARQGYTIVNGLALGCDTETIRGALSADGKVIAVMPCGLDYIYPSQNRELVKEILAKGGCLISEYPPGNRPNKQQFVLRDRIQASISDACCVIATGTTGGTMHTVKFAKKYGKPTLCFNDVKVEKRSGNLMLIENGVCKPFSTGRELMSFIEL